MALILVALSLAYGIPILLVALGHARIRQKVVSGTPPELTVLVAARNESEHIEACLRAILAQDIPVHVLVVDDHSDDDTARRVEAFGARVRLIRLEGGSGKKAAITEAVRHIQTEWVLLTDAFLERNERLYEQVDEAPGTAWRHWLLGEISLQRTWARSKRGDAFKAAWSARRALGHLERARVLNPGLIEPLKGLGLLHMGIGALPDRFRRVLGWFGIEGSLDQGLAELVQARDASVWNR